MVLMSSGASCVDGLAAASGFGLGGGEVWARGSVGCLYGSSASVKIDMYVNFRSEKNSFPTGYHTYSRYDNVERRRFSPRFLCLPTPPESVLSVRILETPASAFEKVWSVSLCPYSVLIHHPSAAKARSACRRIDI